MKKTLEEHTEDWNSFKIILGCLAWAVGINFLAWLISWLCLVLGGAI